MPACCQLQPDTQDHASPTSQLAFCPSGYSSQHKATAQPPRLPGRLASSAAATLDLHACRRTLSIPPACTPTAPCRLPRLPRRPHGAPRPAARGRHAALALPLPALVPKDGRLRPRGRACLVAATPRLAVARARRVLLLLLLLLWRVAAIRCGRVAAVVLLLLGAVAAPAAMVHAAPVASLWWQWAVPDVASLETMWQVC